MMWHVGEKLVTRKTEWSMGQWDRYVRASRQLVGFVLYLWLPMSVCEVRDVN